MEEPIPWHTLPREALSEKAVLADFVGMAEYSMALVIQPHQRLTTMVCEECGNWRQVEAVRLNGKNYRVEYCRTCYVASAGKKGYTKYDAS